MITRIVEKPGSRRCTLTDTGRTYEYVLTVVLDSINDNENTIVRHPSVPRGGTPYVHGSVIDALAICNHIEPVHISRLVWEVTCRFSYEPEDKKNNPGKDPNNNPDPFLRPTKIHWRSKRLEVFQLADVKGKPFVNVPFGERFEEGTPPREIYHAIVTLTRNETAYNPSRAMEYAGKVNSSSWFAIPRYGAKCEFPEATLMYEQKINRWFWEISYSFEIAPELWVPTKIANRGRRSLVAAGVTVPGVNPAAVGAPDLDANGNPTGELMFLDAKGKKINVSKGGKPFMLEFQMYDTIDFNQLNLP